MEPLVFTDLTPIEIPVTLGTKQFILREITEAGAARHKNTLLRNTKVVENVDSSRQVTMDTSDSDAVFVAACLFEVKGDSQFASVELNFVKGLPHRITKQLFDKAEEISGMRKKETKDDLRKKIKELQDKLAKMTKEGEEDTLKNS